MPSRHPHGRISPQQAQRMLASFPAGRRRDEAKVVLGLLTDMHASAVRTAQDIGEVDPEFRGLFPPKRPESPEERDEREAILASARNAQRPYDVLYAQKPEDEW